MNNKSFLKEFEMYLATEKRSSKNTVDSYLRDLKQFVKSIEEKSLDQVTFNDVKLFIKELVDKKTKTSTQNRKIATLRTFYGKFMIREGHIKINPLALVESAKISDSKPNPISLKDIDKLSNVADSLRDKLIVELFYATGARRFELCKMKFSDINKDEKYIKITGKGDKVRFVPIHDMALNLLARWEVEIFAEYSSFKDVVRKGDFIFPGRYGEGHISIRRINEIVTKLKNNAGLKTLDITPHKFRHSFCSHLWEEGADILTIKDLAGHAKTDTTLVYTQLNNKRTQSEYTKFHPRAFAEIQESLPL